MKPIKVGDKRFKRLQKQWYKKLKSDGFVDIESGKDINQYAASTFKGHANTRDAVAFTVNSDLVSGLEDIYDHGDSIPGHIECTELTEAGELMSPADTAKGKAWRKFSQAVHDIEVEFGKDFNAGLNRKYLLMEVAENGCVGKRTAQEHGMTQQEAVQVVSDFCVSIGLPAKGLLGRGRTKKVKRVKRTR